jgi:hypothetical protein
MIKFKGYEMATGNVLKQRANQPIENDPMKDKSVQDIPEVLLADLRSMSEMQRFILLKKFETLAGENAKTKVKNNAKLIRAKAANAFRKKLKHEFCLFKLFEC